MKGGRDSADIAVGEVVGIVAVVAVVAVVAGAVDTAEGADDSLLVEVCFG